MEVRKKSAASRVASAFLAVVLALGLMPALPALAWADGTEGGTAPSAASELPGAQDGVITLTDDVETSTLPDIEGYLVIDLAGHTLTYTGSSPLSLVDGQDLTIKGGAFVAKNMPGVTSPLINVNAGCSVTLEGVTMITNGCALFPTGDAASVTVTDSEVYAPVYAVGTNAGTPDNYGVVITLSNSKFINAMSEDGDGCPIFFNVPGALLIDSCTVVGTRQAVLVRGGVAKIENSLIQVAATDGESIALANGETLELPGGVQGSQLFTGDGAGYDNGDWGSGNEVPAAALVVGNQSENAYQYPASLELVSTIVDNSTDDRPTVYGYTLDEPGREVSFVYDAQSNIGEETDVVFQSKTEDEVSFGTPIATTVDRYGNQMNYSSLDAAISSAGEGQVVKLLSNAEEVPTVKIAEGMSVSIDLNEHDIEFSSHEGSNGTKISDNFEINGGSLTITGNGTVKENDEGVYYAPVFVYGSSDSEADQYSVVNIGEGVTLQGWSGVMIDYNDQNVAYGVDVVVAGKINSIKDNSGAAGHGVYINGTIKATEGNVPEIALTETSEIVSQGNGIYAAGFAIWSLAGDVEGTDALSIKSGAFTISGGTYHATGEFADPAEANGNGSENTGAAVSITSNDGYAKSIDVAISGGTFISENGHALYEGIATKKDDTPAAQNSFANIIIENGTFTGASKKDAIAITTASKKDVVTGGTFSSEIKGDYLAPGYGIEENADGTFSPAAVDPEAEIAGRTFPTLQEAIGHATAGQTVAVLKDVTLEEGLLIQTPITLDLGGNTVSISENSDEFYGIAFIADGAIINGSVVDLHKKPAGSTAQSAVFVQGAKLTLQGVSIQVYRYDESESDAYSYAVYGAAVNGTHIVLNDGTTIKDVDIPGKTSGYATSGGIGVVIYTGSEAYDENIDPLSTLTVNEGVAIETTGYAISGNGQCHNTGITINGGTIVSLQSTSIYHPQGGVLAVNGGEIKGVTGIEIRAGVLNVVDGSITGTGTPTKVDPNGNGTTTTGAGIAVAQHTTKLPLEVNVTGGTVSGYTAFNHDNPQENDEDAAALVNLEISGGTFLVTGGGTNAVWSDGKTEFVSGGSFEGGSVGDYLAPDAAVFVGADGMHTVYPGSDDGVFEGIGGYVVEDGGNVWKFAVKADADAFADSLGQQGGGADVPVVPTTWTVSFVSNGGSAVGTQQVNHESAADEPADPTRSGYVFVGWYADVNLTQPYYFDVPVTGDITLYAKWSKLAVGPVYRAVSVEAGEGGSASASPSTAAEGMTVTVTAVPGEGLEATVAVTDADGDPVAVTDNGDGTYTFEMPGSRVTVSVTFAEPEPAEVSRLGGADRYATSALVSQEAYPEGCDTVIVARGSDFADALAASGLAGLLGAQVILTETDALSSAAATEIERLGASQAIVLGDAFSVSDEAFAQVSALVGGNAERVSGVDRYATALEILAAGEGWGQTAIVARGDKAADALSAAPIAYALAAPVLLADAQGNVSDETFEALRDGGFSRVLVMGDEDSITADALAGIEAACGEGSAVRLGGADRYETSLLAAEWALSEGVLAGDAEVVTAGRDGKFADALSASALAGSAGAPLLLADEGEAGEAALRALLPESGIAKAYVLGDADTLSDEVLALVEELLA